MDMALDDIIKMSKKVSFKGKQTSRTSNKSQRFMNYRGIQRNSKVQRFMNSRSFIRQVAASSSYTWSDHHFLGDRDVGALNAAANFSFVYSSSRSGSSSCCKA